MPSAKLSSQMLAIAASDLPLCQEILQRRRSIPEPDARLPRRWVDFAPLTNIRTGGTVQPFVPYDYQVRLIETIERSPSTIICKSRQLGISELLCNWLLYRAITEPGFTAVVFSKTQRDSSDLAQRIRAMAISLGDLCPEFATESQMKLAFCGLGQISFLPVTARAARGIPSVSVIVFDEAAFIEGIDGVYAAAAPTLAMLGDRGRVIFNSTPNGRNGLFYKIWTEENNWAKVRLHYSQHPIYGADPAWAAKQRRDRNLTEAQWNQEFELDFAESDATVFDPDLVQRQAIANWEQPQPNRRYIAGIDTATGGADYWVMTIWDITSNPWRMVRMYRDRRKTTDYNLAQCVQLLDSYKPLMVAVESNAAGQVALESLIKLRPGLRVIGVATTAQSKRVNTDRIALLLERGAIAFPPGDTVTELCNFRQLENGRREAAAGYHDDIVMAMAIAFAGWETGDKRQSAIGQFVY